METRTITQYKVGILYLADMRGNVDNIRAIAIFTEPEKMRDYLKSQMSPEPWTDEPSADYFGLIHSYHKVFKRGSPLEWFNPPSLNGDDVRSQWVDTIDQAAFTIPVDPIAV